MLGGSHFLPGFTGYDAGSKDNKPGTSPSPGTSRDYNPQDSLPLQSTPPADLSPISSLKDANAEASLCLYFENNFLHILLI